MPEIEQLKENTIFSRAKIFGLHRLDTDEKKDVTQLIGMIEPLEKQTRLTKKHKESEDRT